MIRPPVNQKIVSNEVATPELIRYFIEIEKYIKKLEERVKKLEKS